METFKFNFETMVETKYAEREQFLRAQLEQALLARPTNIADIAQRNLMTEQSAVKERIDFFTAATNLHLQTSVSDAQIAFVRSEEVMSLEHRRADPCGRYAARRVSRA